jgi:enoyl-[acyl-carrier-protein] reductase (NADH)
MSLLDLAGKRGLVVRIASANSIAYGCANSKPNGLVGVLT